MMFLITVSSGFEKQAKEEIRKLVKGKIDLLFMRGLILLETEENFPEKLKSAETICISHVYPVHKRIEITKGKESIDNIVDAVTGIGNIEHDETFAVKCERRGMHDFTSRDIILAVADKITAKVNLKNPQKVVVIQIVQDVCFIGIIKSEDIIVKEIKSGKKYEQRPLNRAEFKLREAIELFGIEINPEWRALDIGASPGGWTKVLAEKVKEVVAVDPGEMSIELPNIRHIKKRIENAGDLGTFDIVVNDMNLNPEESSQIMCRLAESLKPEGIAVMTVKFVTRNRTKHIKDAESILSEYYDIKGIKKMPHNKYEITLFMVKKQNLKSS